MTERFAPWDLDLWPANHPTATSVSEEEAESLRLFSTEWRNATPEERTQFLAVHPLPPSPLGTAWKGKLEFLENS